MTCRLAPMIGLLATLLPALAHAQTNLDQGKSAAQLFANGCAECHKAPRGLAKGKSSATLTDFLREHYTTSRDQAAALAAYVLGEAGAQAKGQKPAAEHASAAAEEPKSTQSKSTEPKSTEPKSTEPKPTKRQTRQPRKPDEGAPATANLQRPTGDEVKPESDTSLGEPRPQGAGPATGSQEQRPATAARNRRKEPKTPAPEAPAAIAHVPAAVVAEPAPAETPTQEASPSPAPDAVPDVPSGENAPVPRDDVPD